MKFNDTASGTSMQGDFVIYLDERAGVSARALRVAAWMARFALVLTFVSVVTDQLGLWGATGTEATLLWLLPRAFLRIGTWITTVFEIILALALLTGWQLRRAALLSAIVFLLYGLVVCVSVSKPLTPLACFAFAGASAASLLFATQPDGTAGCPQAN